MSEEGYWLPEDYVLRLTALELGCLVAVLYAAKDQGIGSALINKRGPNGEKVPIEMIDRLIEKVRDEAPDPGTLPDE